MFTLILIGLVSFLFFFYFKIKFSYWEKRGIKGPRPIPFFGTSLAVFSLPARELESKFFKEYGKVYGTYRGTQPFLNISDPGLIKIVLSDLKTFPSLNAFAFNDKYLVHSMFFKNGLDWKTTRAAQTHYFTSKRFKSLFIHFKKVSSNFLENLEFLINQSKTGDVEIKNLSKFYGIDTIAKVLFAIDVDSFKEQDTAFVKNATELGEINKYVALMTFFLPAWMSKLFGLNALNITPMNKLGDHFIRVLKERKQNNIEYNDLSEILQKANDADRTKLTEKEIIGNILLSFFAGVEPVSNAICHMFHFLSENPKVQAKLYDEIRKEFNDEIDYEKLTQNEYLDAVFNEVLRLSVSFLQVGRTAAKDTKLGDINIEKGTEIVCITYVPNVSTEQYLDPHTFNPDRFLKSSNDSKVENASTNLFAPFGYGPKQCLGMRLATIETKYLFVRILKKYEICKPKDPVLKRTSFKGFIGTEAMNVSFKERV